MGNGNGIGIGRRVPRWTLAVMALGFYMSAQGYHSRDGDQAYRLPILLHQQNPALYPTDPFVRAFDQFNPHRGYLALLELASRPAGLSVALFGLYATTFFLTVTGHDRLTRAVWPEHGERVGALAALLILLTRAGNIGTNHLFDSTLLDRLIALSLGWNALAGLISDPARGFRAAPFWLGAATLVHPSLGLQLALLVIASKWVWSLRPAATGVSPGQALRGTIGMALGLAPGLLLVASQSSKLMEGLPEAEFRLLSLHVQGPQHMLPHLWRWSQWLAWFAFPALVLPTVRTVRSDPAPARTRFALLLGILLLGLVAAWVAVEPLDNLKVAVFQPFRMATVARGLCLVAIAGRALTLWDRNQFFHRLRVVVLATGLTSDLAMVVASCFELVVTLGESIAPQSRYAGVVPGLLVLTGGLVYLSRHDTQSGYIPILAASAGLVVWSLLIRIREKSRNWTWSSTPARWARWMALAWIIPLAALIVARAGLTDRWGWAHALVDHCRFGETPIDDIERLAVWCREHTPPQARFIGPPGPKTFRLWSQRDLAFNRAGSPYHAEGLADWAARFRDHVGFAGTTAEFAQTYLTNRQKLEAQYDQLSPAELASLARRQQADYIVARASLPLSSDAPLQPLHREGRYAVYCLVPGSDSL